MSTVRSAFFETNGSNRAAAPDLLELVPDPAHPDVLGFPPLRRLQGHIDPRRQQAEKGCDGQPGSRRGLDEEEVTHGRERGRLNQIDRHRRDKEHSRTHLCDELKHRVLPHENNDDRRDPQEKSVHSEWHRQPNVLGGEVIHDGGGGHESSRLANRALDHRRDQDVPQRPFAPGRGVRVHDASAGGMSESKRHLEAVVLEHVGDRDAPQQGILKPPSGHRRGDEMAGSDASHHQDHARAKVLRESPRASFWGVPNVSSCSGCCAIPCRPGA